MFLVARKGIFKNFSEGKSTVQFLVKWKNGKFNEIALTNVLYNLKLRRNLSSGTKLEKVGVESFVER